MEWDNGWFVIGILALIVGGLLGGLILSTHTVETEYVDVPVEVPVEVEKIVNQTVEVEVEKDYLAEAFEYALDEEWDKFKYCDGDKYYDDEVTWEFDDLYWQKFNDDYYKIVFFVEGEYDADDPGYRCDADYKVKYIVEDDEDPVVKVFAL